MLVTARKFRKLSPEAKEARYGMRNLWDPVKRTELCPKVFGPPVIRNRTSELRVAS